MTAFDWGCLAGAPFLPRLVIKTGPAARLVISPACWHPQAEMIVARDEGAPETRWFQGLHDWREQRQVPRYVYLTDGDNRLLLDLENPLMATELRDELGKLKDHMHLALEEVLPDFAHLWLRDEQDAGYFSEIVVPLLRADAVDSTVRSAAQAKPFPPSKPVISSVERKCFPGEDWIYLKLYAALSQHEELLAGPMRDVVRMLQEHNLLDRWFFLRYADPEPHLRLRFHAKESSAASAILALVLPWSTKLARRGQIQRFSLETYERERERYGGPESIDLLEQTFTVDSGLVSDLVAFQHARRLTLDPLAVAVFSLDHFFTAWGWNLGQRLKWTRQASEKYAWSKEFRGERKRYCDLLSPRTGSDPELAKQRALVLELARPHTNFLAALGVQVRQLAEVGALWVLETSLLSSLAHMHVNRLLGIDRGRENQVYAFWRHTLDSLERHPGLDHARGEERAVLG